MTYEECKINPSYYSFCFLETVFAHLFLYLITLQIHTLCTLLYKLHKPSHRQISQTLQQIAIVEPTHYAQISPTDIFSSLGRKITETKVWPRSMKAKHFPVHFFSIFMVTEIGHDIENVHTSNIIKNELLTLPGIKL
jgi:hypothetical protein